MFVVFMDNLGRLIRGNSRPYHSPMRPYSLSKSSIRASIEAVSADYKGFLITSLQLTILCRRA